MKKRNTSRVYRDHMPSMFLHAARALYVYSRQLRISIARGMRVCSGAPLCHCNRSFSTHSSCSAVRNTQWGPLAVVVSPLSSVLRTTVNNIRTIYHIYIQTVLQRHVIYIYIYTLGSSFQFQTVYSKRLSTMRLNSIFSRFSIVYCTHNNYITNNYTRARVEVVYGVYAFTYRQKRIGAIFLDQENGKNRLSIPQI